MSSRLNAVLARVGETIKVNLSFAPRVAPPDEPRDTLESGGQNWRRELIGSLASLAAWMGPAGSVNLVLCRVALARNNLVLYFFALLISDL